MCNITNTNAGYVPTLAKVAKAKIKKKNVQITYTTFRFKSGNTKLRLFHLAGNYINKAGSNVLQF